MRWLPLILLMTSPAVARADAIMPFEGECPPGSERGIADHSEACIPKSCDSDGDCGWGASCVTYCVCMADREITNDGRVVFSEPRTVNMQVSLCQAGRTCLEGEPMDTRQCEPDDETPAFDRDRHRWTREPHPSGCAGCAVPRGGGAAPVALIALGLLLWWRR